MCGDSTQYSPWGDGLMHLYSTSICLLFYNSYMTNIIYTEQSLVTAYAGALDKQIDILAF